PSPVFYPLSLHDALPICSGGSQGVGFAIPANLARSVMDQLIEKGKMERGFLGVGIQDLTPELARQFKVPDNTSGALVTQLEERRSEEHTSELQSRSDLVC